MKNIFNLAKKIFQRVEPFIYQIFGSFIIVAGWNWYHLAKRPHWRFILITAVMGLILTIGFSVFKRIYLWVVTHYKRHSFWQTDFLRTLDSLYFILSLNFLVFFFRNELYSLIYVSAIIIFFFYQLHKFLAGHPNSKEWQGVNKMVFTLFFFLFLLNNLLQYLGYKFYILDPNARFYDIVLFRSFSLTMFWLFGFAVAGFLFTHVKSAIKYLFIFLWALLHLSVLFLWVVNIGVLYFSGLYFSPIALEHAQSGGAVMWNWLTYILVAGYILVFIAFIFLLKKLMNGYRQFPRRLWNYYNSIIIIMALATLVGLSSIRTTAEFSILKNFYQYYFGQTVVAEISGKTLAKLEKFGLHYDLSNFYIAQKPNVYTKEISALPEHLQVKKPNIIIIFLESFSSRLTDTGGEYKNITPGLSAMAADPHTTVIKKYYNASTPTVTGLISQLCSFLTPTGHEEFERGRMLKHLYLYCLPEALKDGGYKYAGYITAVDKEFANKGEVFASMGVDDFFGTGELKDYIAGEQLAWGYSDHQMFPIINKVISEKATEPYLIMLSTVDSHPPYTMVKDVVPYGDGKNDVLNTIHTTDDAFGKFWSSFKDSPAYKNTVLITVADHAIFPAAYSKDMLKNTKEKLTFYDETFFQMYIPDSNLPNESDIYSSGLDFAPTLLHVLGINKPNAFEGHSIFDDRTKYPNLLGMHEFGLFINQINKDGKRVLDYALPADLKCGGDGASVEGSALSLCEFLQYYKWKRTMFEQGKFNKGY